VVTKACLTVLVEFELDDPYLCESLLFVVNKFWDCVE